MADKKGQREPLDFNAIQIQLASPDVIRSWSYGEVTSPETINYRSFRPEKDGLFCERIFGPQKDFECACGKYKGIRFKGVVCDRCGVEVTYSRVRRERMGHIELAVPVAHVWFLRSPPSRVGTLLGLSVNDLESIVYYENYIVLDPGDTSKTHLTKKQLLTEEEYRELKSKGVEFEAMMGASALKLLLQELDLDEIAENTRSSLKSATSEQKKRDLLKRLKVVEAFRESKNKPEWMILDVIPVLPPDLRPLVALDGGRFATSDLNELYRKLINRNNRLKKLIDISSPEVIIRNEKRMLQEAVDALIDGPIRHRAFSTSRTHPLKSLSEFLKGKKGRFRQNLLGKRVDYSGRAVIVVGPELKMNECGLPKTMALELFKPFILRKLEERGITQSIKRAKKIVEERPPEVWDLLEEAIKDHPVLLNRAPTLHRLGIQAFYPKLIEGKAIQLHPLVCAAFNADFDGDLMAVHIPLSYEAQLEAILIMLSTNNILLPASGEPVATPSQDMVLGLTYLTKEIPSKQQKIVTFSSPEEVIIAYDHGKVALHEKLKVRVDGRIIETTTGRVIFNQIVPDELEFVNKELNGKILKQLVAKAYQKCGRFTTAEFLDALKDIGFKYATLSGLSIGIDDVVIPKSKQKILDIAQKEVESINEKRRKNLITDGERYNTIIDVWTRTQGKITDELFKELSRYEQGFNPLWLMISSGARGKGDQIRQLGGMRGLMTKPQKKLTGREIIETPIKSNFKEGLTVLEYFISSHGGRKGLADTALKTSEAGYLTRRLVDVVQDVIVQQEDCGTIIGVERSALKDGEKIIEPLSERILGRYAIEDIIDPATGETIVEAEHIITPEACNKIEEAGIETVRIRSVLTCESPYGVCAKCYGQDLATGENVTIGEAVGIIAGESIGEPGTQLTLRTFHIGGTASLVAQRSDVNAKQSGTVKYIGLRTLPSPSVEGASVIVSRNGHIVITDRAGIEHNYNVPYGSVLFVKDGEFVETDQKIYSWEPYASQIICEFDGTVQYVDIIKNKTVKEQIDELTMKKQIIVTETKERHLNPRIIILDDNGKPLDTYLMPVGAHIIVPDGKKVKAGTPLVKMAREISKTRDITGGLPRVAELFEARRPKNPAIISEVNGTVEFIQQKTQKKVGQKIIVHGDQGEDREYLIPRGKHILVRNGEKVTAGQKLCAGPIVPQDILRVNGVNAVAEYLLNEVQQVYRLQGVKINDKHIEIIIRQMLRKVIIVDPGDTKFMENEQVSRTELTKENERVKNEGKIPAKSEPVLLGITKSALSTEGFISAASFQETTRVLTAAAIQGAVDHLRGLKENVILGNLIPAGTGSRKNRKARPVVIKEEEEHYDFAEETEQQAAPFNIKQIENRWFE